MKEVSKTPLIGMSEPELKMVCSVFGEPTFRAKQLFRWLYKSKINTIDEMMNIPKRFRKKLCESYSVHPLTLKSIEGSRSEPTRKFLFELDSGEKIESVFMREKDRTTICVSSQAGCAADCTFCATASIGFQKNLTAGEIVDQFLQVMDQTKSTITNVVFMGMGEPFLNYDNVITAATLLNNQHGIKLGARRITISTVGIVPKIISFADERHRFKLAVSLNSPSQGKRAEIMPLAKKYTMETLLESMDYYSSKLRKPVTLEYVLLKNVNDSPEDGKKLLNELNRKKIKLNLIPYNEIGGNYYRPSKERIEVFMHELKNAQFPVTVRISKGTDISAGCGQLAGRGKNNDSV